MQLFHFAVLPPSSTWWAFASVACALQNTCSMQQSQLKLNSFYFACHEFKRLNWRHLAHSSCSSATAGMHVARIQNCPRAHLWRLRIKHCSKNFIYLVLSFRVQDPHLEVFLNPSLCSFSASQCFSWPAPSGHLQVSLVPFRTPAACMTLHENLMHFVSGFWHSRNMIGGIQCTSCTALPLPVCMLQGFKIDQEPIHSS